MPMSHIDAGHRAELQVAGVIYDMFDDDEHSTADMRDGFDLDGNEFDMERLGDLFDDNEPLTMEEIYDAWNPSSELDDVMYLHFMPFASGPNPQVPPVIENVRNVRVAEGSSTTINVRATDANNDSIRLSLQSNPSWVSISDNNDGTGLITVNVPDEVSQSRYSMRAVATDNDGTDTDTFRVYITEVNEDPVLDTIGSKFIQERQNLSFTVSATDSDRPAQTLRYSIADTPPPSPIPDNISLNPVTGEFSWTPNDRQKGFHSYIFTVTDSEGATDSETISIVVTAIPDSSPNKIIRPTSSSVTSTSATISWNAPSAGTSPITGYDIFREASPKILIATVPSTQLSYVDSTVLPSTTYQYTVSAKNQHGSGGQSDPITITTLADTIKPVIVLTPPNQITLTQGEVYSESGAICTDDIDGNISNVTVTSNVNTAAPGTYQVTYDCQDAAGNSAVQVTRTVNVIASQVPPVLSSISDVTVDEGQVKSFTVTATDENNDTITYSLIDSPDWVTISGSTVTISTPTELSDTSYSGTVKATTHDGVDTDTFRINITEVNQIPTLSLIDDVNGEESQLISFTVTASDSDIPIQSLSFSMTGNPPAGAVIDGTTGLFSWTPNNSQVGTYTITFMVTDNGTPSYSDSQDVTFTIVDITAPIITVNPTDVNIEFGVSSSPVLLDGVSTDDGSDVTATGTIDINTIGSYIITFNSVDESGNNAISVIRTYTVADTIPPIITVNPTDVNIEFGVSSSPILLDGVSTDDGSDVTVTGSVDVTTIGDHIITFNSVDESGNVSISVTRTYNVIDTISPIITVNPDTITLEAGSAIPNLLDGVSTDDGSDVTTTGTININKSGSYTITFNSVDESGNNADSVIRTYTVEDTTAPELVEFDLALNTVVSESNLTLTGTAEAGTTITLLRDQYISFSIIVADDGTWSIDVILSEGQNPFFAKATDESGNTSRPSVGIVVLETGNPPVITLLGDNPLTIELGSIYKGFYADANTDDRSEVIVDSSEFMDKVGTYSIFYDSTDPAGNKAIQVIRIVHVVNSTAPPVPVITTLPSTTISTSPITINGNSSEAGEVIIKLYNGEILVDTINTVDVTTGAFSFFEVALDEGANIFTVTATNSIGNTSVPSDSVTITLDTVLPPSPVFGTPADNITSISSTGIHGVSEDVDVTIKLYNKEILVGTTTPNVLGVWQFTNITLDEGVNIFTVTATNSIGNVSLPSNSIIMTLTSPDTTPPEKPTINQLQTSTTSYSFLTITGTAEVGTTVLPTINDVLQLNSVKVGSDGNWSIAVTLSEGDNTVTVSVTDAAGNTSVSSDSIAITLNSPPPQPPAPDPIAEIITQTSIVNTTESFVISGTSVNADQVALYREGVYTDNFVTLDDSGNWSFDVVLNEGENVLGVTVTNVDGVMFSPDDIIITLDTIPPETPMLINPSEIDPIVYENPTTFTGTAEAGSIVTLYSHRDDLYTTPVSDDGTWSVSVAIPDIINGFFAYVTDSADNESDRLPIGVIFDDNNPSIITLNGDNPQTIDIGSGGYTELGATTNDYFPVIIDDTAFMDKVGTYSILYDSVDSLGNHAVQVIRIVYVVDPTSTPQTLLNDTFDDDSLDGWQKYSRTGTYSGHITPYERYNLSLDRTTGSPSPSAHISGDGFVSSSGMYKTVDISSVSEDSPLYLSFDYRAKSGHTGSSVTNTHLGIYDEVTGVQLHNESLIAGGTRDSGWQRYNTDISGVTSGHDTITIRLYLKDSWGTNWNQQNWYDNVTLGVEQQPIGQSSPIIPSDETITPNSNNDVTLSVIITTPPNFTFTTAESFVINGTSSNADQVALYRDGTYTNRWVAPDDSGYWSFDVMLNEGENILGVTVSNDGDMVSPDDIIVTLDTTPPPK